MLAPAQSINTQKNRKKKEKNLVQLVFIIPLALCVAWFLYLKANDYSLEQGKQGFVYILSFSVLIAGFYGLMFLLTH